MTNVEWKPGPEGTDENWSLQCNLCGATYALAPLVFGCPDCSRDGRIGVLDLRFTPPARTPPLADRQRSGLARYRDLLPGGDRPDWLSLGEGGTPLIPSRHIGPALGLSRLYFKNEAANPTGSFKDRYVCVAINTARIAGFRNVVATSTGNLGVSVAAYAAAADMGCAIVLPHEAPATIVDELRRFGARILTTTATRRVTVFEEIAHQGSWFPIFATFRRPVQNPFGVEAYKTFAYEMVEQLNGAPAMVLFPCARGNGLYGAWKGFRESVQLGWARTTPRMVACQPIGCNSLEVSLQRGSTQAVELPRQPSIAQSAAETVASDHALAALRESDGYGVSVSEAEIANASEDMLSEGLAVETSAALPIAGLRRLAARDLLPKDAAIVCVLTAAGLRWPVAPPPGAPQPIEVPDGHSVIDLLM